MKKNRIMKRCLIPAAAAGMVLLAGCEGEWAAEEWADTKQEMEVYDISGNYSRLDIQTDLAEVTIRTGDTASMEVCMEEGYVMDRTEKDGTLYLTEQDRKPFWRKIIHFGSVENSVVITLPENAVEELTVSCDNSDVNICGQKISSITAREKNADVNLSDCQGSEIRIENKNGDVSLENVMASLEAELKNGDLMIQNSSGESLYVTNTNGKLGTSGVNYKEFHAECVNGEMDLGKVDTDSIVLKNTNDNVFLELKGTQADYDYSISNNNGKAVIGESTVGDSQVNFQFSNNTGRTVDADLKNGNLTVAFFEDGEE